MLQGAVGEPVQGGALSPPLLPLSQLDSGCMVVRRRQVTVWEFEWVPWARISRRTQVAWGIHYSCEAQTLCLQMRHQKVILERALWKEASIPHKGKRAHGTHRSNQGLLRLLQTHPQQAALPSIRAANYFSYHLCLLLALCALSLPSISDLPLLLY